MSNSTDLIFTLRRYNPRRNARNAEAASVEVLYPDGEKELLWMSQQNIRDNIKTHGMSKGLSDALAAYKNNTEIDL